MAEQYTVMFNSQFTASRIKHLADFGISLINNDTFKYQLYEHAASVLASIEQKSPNMLTHFTSIMSLGTVTESLARHHQWDIDYIHRVQALYRLEDHDTQKWMAPFNKYLERRHDFRGAEQMVKILLNDVIRPDPKFDLTKVQVPNMGDQIIILSDDLKMITLSTDVLNIQGTIYQLERAFSTSTQISDDEQISTVEEVITNTLNAKIKI